MKTICAFAGSSVGRSSQFNTEAFRLGQMIGSRGHKIIYGGGRTGLMGAFADGALSSGADVTGVIPEFLNNREVAHTEIGELVITNSMHERKSYMYKEATDFVVLPGGLGSLDETMEVLTWCQLKIINARVHILNIDGYWQPLRDLLSHIVEQGFIHSTNLDYVLWAKNADELIDNL